MPNFEGPSQFNPEEQVIIPEKQKEGNHQEKEQETLKLKGVYKEARDLFFRDPRDDLDAEGRWDDLNKDEKEEVNREVESRNQRLRNLASQHGREFVDMTIANIKDIASERTHPVQLESEEGLLRFLAREGGISPDKDLLNSLREKIYTNGVEMNTQKIQELLQSGNYSTNEVFRLKRGIEGFIEKGKLDLPEETKLKLMRLGITAPDKK